MYRGWAGRSCRGRRLWVSTRQQLFAHPPHLAAIEWRHPSARAEQPRIRVISHGGNSCTNDRDDDDEIKCLVRSDDVIEHSVLPSTIVTIRSTLVGAHATLSFSNYLISTQEMKRAASSCNGPANCWLHSWMVKHTSACKALDKAITMRYSRATVDFVLCPMLELGGGAEGARPP